MDDHESRRFGPSSAGAGGTRSRRRPSIINNRLSTSISGIPEPIRRKQAPTPTPAADTNEERHRAQIYAVNAILRKLEIEKFEQLKADVASGKEVLDTSSWHSENSSGSPSPTNRTEGERFRSLSAGVASGGAVVGTKTTKMKSIASHDEVSDRGSEIGISSSSSSLRTAQLRFGGV
jgi:hypothetical protein